MNGGELLNHDRRKSHPLSSAERPAKGRNYRVVRRPCGSPPRIAVAERKNGATHSLGARRKQWDDYPQKRVRKNGKPKPSEELRMAHGDRTSRASADACFYRKRRLARI